MMKSISFPLRIEKGCLAREDSVRKSIDDAIEMLLNTPVGECPCDSEYGFTLQNMKFEMVNEIQGTIYKGADATNQNYNKKISGTSTNMQTFAADLNAAIVKYERRLLSPTTTLTYVNKQRTIMIVVKGVIEETGEQYMYTTSIKLWA